MILWGGRLSGYQNPTRYHTKSIQHSHRGLRPCDGVIAAWHLAHGRVSASVILLFLRLRLAETSSVPLPSCPLNTNAFTHNETVQTCLDEEEQEERQTRDYDDNLA